PAARGQPRACARAHLGRGSRGEHECRRPLRLLPAAEARRAAADRDRARRRLHPGQMTGRSLQTRSVAAAALAILLALVVVCLGVDLLVSRHLRRTLDHTLRQRAVEVSQLSASAPALLTTPGALDSPIGGAQLIVEVVDRRGRIVARSLSLGGRVLPTAQLVRSAIDRGRTGYEDAQLGDEHLRAYTAPLTDFGGPAAGGAVVVAASTHDLNETLASLHLFVLVSGLI